MTIQEIEQKLNECQKALAELKESKKEGKWKPKSAEEYWFRDISGGYEFCHRYEGDGWDDWRVNNIPIFKTQDECERYWHFMDTVKEKSYEFTTGDWNNVDIKKWVIVFDYKDNRFFVDDFSVSRFFGIPYFKTVADAKYIIDNFKEELKEYWL